MAGSADDPKTAEGDRNGRPDHRKGNDAGGAPASSGVPGGATAETVDRDALHQADYGGAREPADIPSSAPAEANQQGGFAADDAAGGGRKPTGDRDRDYDPDGDRSGL